MVRWSWTMRTAALAGPCLLLAIGLILFGQLVLVQLLNCVRGCFTKTEGSFPSITLLQLCSGCCESERLICKDIPGPLC